MLTLTISTKEKHAISPYLYMQFMEPLGVCDSSVDAGWDFIEERWYPQLIERVRELAPTMVRFGGCFASYYHWKEAVGPIRTPMMNYCWSGVYQNQVGTHEVVDFCRQVNAEPLLVVNMESDGRMHWAHPKNGTDRFGTAEEAAEWVAYCNHADNPLRLSHGVQTPYNVRWWQIGNETSYDARGYNVDQCVEVTKRFAEKMLAADDSIRLIGWGDESKTDDSWCRRMSEVDGVDLIAFHHHFGSGLPDSPLTGTDYRRDPELTWRHLMNAHRSMQDHIDRMRSDCGSKRLAMTEGHFAIPGRNRCEVLSSWGAGVAYARCHNVIMRNSDILDIATMADFFGNVWQVNAVLIPTPPWDRKPYLQPVGSVMSLFAHHQGQQAVDVTSTETVDAVASITGSTLYLHLANTDMHAAQVIHLDTGDRRIAKATMHFISADPTTEITMLNPEVFAPQVQEIEGTVLTLPAAAVAAVEIQLA